MNLYTLPDPASGKESFFPLHQSKGLKIEAIRSRLSEPGEHYNQEDDEWVVLIRGEASLEVEGKIYALREGDSLFLPKHTRHQVLSTSDDALWLAVFSS